MAATILSILKLSFVESEGVEHQDKHAAQTEDGSLLFCIPTSFFSQRCPKVCDDLD